MQRFLDKQTEATRRTSASLEQVTASSTAYSSAVEKSAAASTRLAADVDQTRQRVEALGRKLREEQAQSAAVAAAQDRTSGMYMTGASMVLGGVAQMLAPKPKMSEMRQTDNGRQNTYFSSLDNMVANGNTLPVLYGEMQVGSRVISQEVSTADEGDGGQVVVIGR